MVVKFSELWSENSEALAHWVEAPLKELLLHWELIEVCEFCERYDKPESTPESSGSVCEPSLPVFNACSRVSFTICPPPSFTVFIVLNKLFSSIKKETSL